MTRVNSSLFVIELNGSYLVSHFSHFCDEILISSNIEISGKWFIKIFKEFYRIELKMHIAEILLLQNLDVYVTYTIL